jgi:hypothetical protein
MRGAEGHPQNREHQDKNCVDEKISMHNVVKTKARAMCVRSLEYAYGVLRSSEMINRHSPH